MSDHLNAQTHNLSAHHDYFHRPVTLKFLLILQGLPALGVLALGAPSYAMFNEPVPWMAMSFVIGGVACFLTYLANYPWRYRIIQALVAPTTWLILHLVGKV